MRNKLFVLALLLSFGGASSVLAAEGTEPFVLPKGEFFGGFLLPRTAIGGDFDGDSILVDGTPATRALLLPDIDPNFGFGVTAGVKQRIKPNFAISIEGSYIQSDHTYEQGFLEGTAKYRSLMFDLKGYFQAQNRVQPYVQVGVGFPALQIGGGYLSGTGQSQATYHGVALNFGAGFLIYATRHVAFHFAGVLRPTSYPEVEYGERTDIDDPIQTNSLNLDMGLTFRFSPQSK